MIVAERVRSRLQNQVDERRNPRTRANLGQLLDKWLDVLDVDPSTRRTYDGYIRKHIRPLLGELSLTRLDVEVLDSFYSELRRCRDHCGGHRSADSHRLEGKTHVCRGLANSTAACLADATPAKQGLYSPGMRIPIRSPEHFRTDKPDYALLLAWNHKDEILRKEAEYRAAGGKFIIPLPKVEVI